MPWIKGKSFIKVSYLLILAALVIVVAAAGFDTLRTVAFRISSGFFYPYLSLPASGKYIIADRSLLLHSRSELAAALEKQQKTNRSLAAKAAVVAELAVENEELRRLLKLKPRPDYNYIAAEIILRDPVNWQEGFVISKGRADGIKEGTPVLCFTNGDSKEPILTGIVKNTSKHSAQVTSVISPHFRISAYLTESKSYGFLNVDDQQRRDPGKVNISYLPTGHEYKLGQRCVTTGFERKVPAGIDIGRLSEMLTSNSAFDNNLYESGIVDPMVNLENIHFVLLPVFTDKTENKER
ncbi:MAG: rod shape-determining protein MreC [Lentisphaerae bacterium]|nr:rod shape-determining protein MreC [Lentisphaerota bacterium]MCP4101970.1 rod shape-determining protein MreC [Lentisphaerota bacterium]